MSAFEFIIALAISSTAIGLLWLAFGGLITRLRHWPLFWAAGLIATVATAVFAALWPHIGGLFPQIQAPSLAVIPAFDIASWPAFSEGFVQAQTSPMIISFIPQAFLTLYVIGAIISLLRLMIGRYRAANLARNAAYETLPSGAVIGVTPDILPCMAYTPFGRPEKSHIIITDSFKAELSEAQFAHVIAHERAHIDRRDDEMGTALRLILAALWFNPVAYILFDRWRVSAELQCDQIAVKGQSHPMRRAYAETLLQALHISANRVRQYPAASLSTQHLRNEKMRINKIMNGAAPIFKHVGHKSLLAVSAAALSLSGAFALSAAAQNSQTPEMAIDVMNAAAPQPLIQPAAQTTPPTFKLSGKLTSSFGPAIDPFNKGKARNHHGVDFAAPLGTPIYAPKDAIILDAADIFNGKPNYGKVVVFQTRDGVQTMMAHLHNYDVKKGQQVSKGQKLAEIGSTGKSTGPHVHIETRVNGQRVDPASIWTFEK